MNGPLFSSIRILDAIKEVGLGTVLSYPPPKIYSTTREHSKFMQLTNIVRKIDTAHQNDNGNNNNNNNLCTCFFCLPLLFCFIYFFIFCSFNDKECEKFDGRR